MYISTLGQVSGPLPASNYTNYMFLPILVLPICSDIIYVIGFAIFTRDIKQT